MIMSGRKLTILSVLCAVTFFTSPAQAQLTDDDFQPRTFDHSDESTIISPGTNAVREIEMSYPSQTQSMVNMLRRMLMAKKHKATFKQEGKKITIQDLTDKRTWILKTRHDVDKKFDTRGLEVVVTFFPNNCSIPFYVSRVFDKQKQYGKALEYYRKASDILNRKKALNKETQSDHDRSVEVANYAYFEGMMGRYESAVKDFSRAIELRPDYMPNYFNRAQAYRKLHKPELADADEKKAKSLSQAKTGPNRGGARNMQGAEDAMALIDGHAYELGLELANRALAKNAKDSMAQLERARALLKLGQYKESLAAYRLVKVEPRSADDLKAELEVAERMAKSGPAPYGDLSVLKSNPGRPYPVYEKGKRVMLTVDKIAANHPGDYRVYEAIARAQKKAGNARALDEELNKLIALSPNNMELVCYKIESSQSLRHWSDAEKQCTHYLDMIAHDVSDNFNLDFFKYVYSIRALARRALNNCDGAIADENTLLKIEPDLSDTYYDRGDCYMRAGKYALAVDDYTKSIQLDDTKSGDSYERRARAYDRLNKSDLARADRETAKRLSGTKTVRPD